MAQYLNHIERKSVGELMDGRYLYIPDYQRGYRWTPQQVEDLLRDLLTFIDEKKEADFYSLQPIIARKVKEERFCDVFKDREKVPQDAKEKGVWEIVDGQQRLTTLLLLYKYLLRERGWTPKTLKEKDNKELYHIIYQSRPQSEQYLQGLGSNEEADKQSCENVDFYHMRKSYDAIPSYLCGMGREYCKTAEGDVSCIEFELFRLLNGRVGAKHGSVQVMWYELVEDGSKDLVEEFQKINSGKIKLTDAELIKALLMRSRNFDELSSALKQEQSALEWEMFENRLQDNSFWCFICRKDKGTKVEIANRIDFIFSLIYKKEKKEEVSEKDLADARKSIVFRYFSQKLEYQEAAELKEKIEGVWDSVRGIFWLLEDWYHNPEIYNLIGLLTQFGKDVTAYVTKSHEMKQDDKGRHDFLIHLKEDVCKELGADIDDVCGYSYDRDKTKVKKTLLAINIALLNMQCQKEHERDKAMYKFPFADYIANKWDIEHIDSFHSPEDKMKDSVRKAWIETALKDVPLSDNECKEFELKKDEDKVEWLRKRVDENQNDDETKNSLANLALLDASTNRSYGNALFCTKRRFIIERVKNGIFVPPVTQFVFFKLFDESGTNRSRWTQADMGSYMTEIRNLLAYYYHPNYIL